MADTLSEIRLRCRLRRQARRHARHSVHDKTVCIIDDEMAMRQSLESLVRSMGVRVRLYASAEAFLEQGRSGPLHCIVCDIQMQRMSGIELLACLRAGRCDVPVIFVTAHPSARRLLEARRLGAMCVLEKPFDPRELVQWLMRALARC
ncbi:Response regulatory domain-containing protein [Burkholderia latens]